MKGMCELSVADLAQVNGGQVLPFPNTCGDGQTGTTYNQQACNTAFGDQEARLDGINGQTASLQGNTAGLLAGADQVSSLILLALLIALAGGGSSSSS
jgi:hypothetical protein